MEQCNVCNSSIPVNSGSFIPGLIKGVGVYGCDDCKDASEKAKLIANIRDTQEKYYKIFWLDKNPERPLYTPGHHFIFRDGSTAIIQHLQGNCGLDELVEYIESSDYANDVVYFR